MRRLLMYYILGLVALGSVHAQTTNLFERHREILSPSEKRFNRYAVDMDVRQIGQLYANPVYPELVHNQDSLFRKERYRSVITTGYSTGEVKGDFLPYEGNGFSDYRVQAAGEYSIRSSGTLFGSAQYARGKHENIGWSAMRYPELYLPYISTDSIGGDYEYEDYRVDGGYAFSFDDWTFGVTGSFHGEEAYRKTDPRALNNTTWLNVGAGISRCMNGHLLMAQGSFGRNKQHMDLHYWRPGEQDRFFVSYGFGLYDVRQSVVSFGYSRMYYIKEGSARLTYQSPAGNPLVVYASMGYEYDRMKTEETNICDLYYSKTHTLLPSVKLDWQPSSSWTLSLWMEGRIDKRKGFENIFERYLSDEANNIYDYRLVDTQQKYTTDQSELLAQLRIRYYLNPNHTLGFQGGLGSFSRTERYKVDGYEVKNTSLFPHGRLDYRMNLKRSEIELFCLYGKQIAKDNRYDVIMKNQSIPHLDFQHTFAPYAYYNSNFSSVQVSASYVYHLKKCALGMNLKFMYTNGDRDEEAVFTQPIGYPSSAPMIDATPDKHDEVWGGASLFLVF